MCSIVSFQCIIMCMIQAIHVTCDTLLLTSALIDCSFADSKSLFESVFE